MTYKKTLYVQIISCLILACVFILGYYILPQERKTKNISSVLFNKKYLAGATQISVSQGDEKLRIEKQDNLWWATHNEVKFLVDKKVLDNFFQLFAAERVLSVQANNLKSIDRYGLSDSDGFLVEIESNEKSFSKIILGAKNIIGNKIFLYALNKKIIYSTENNLQQFLTFDKTFWADMTIIPQYNQLNANEIKRFSYIKENKTESFTRSMQENTAADDFLHRLLTMRGGGIFSAKIVENLNEATTVYFESQKGNHQVTFYIYGEHYLAHFDDLPYVLELSTWSYQRLFSE
ncbi:MAG: DUF4340 domain-containing protein [Treponemataceae bacterium]